MGAAIDLFASHFRESADAENALLEETEEEFHYRQKYFKSEEEVVKNLTLCCTVCSGSLKAAVLNGCTLFHHPVLKVLMCKRCFDLYSVRNFPADGSNRYCRWCGTKGSMSCCSQCCCAFCKDCITQYFGLAVLAAAENNKWKCVVCNVQLIWALRAVCASAQLYCDKINRNKQSENENNPQ